MINIKPHAEQARQRRVEACFLLVLAAPKGKAMGTLYAGICFVTGQDNLFKNRRIPMGTEEIF